MLAMQWHPEKKEQNLFPEYFNVFHGENQTYSINHCTNKDKNLAFLAK